MSHWPLRSVTLDLISQSVSQSLSKLGIIPDDGPESLQSRTHLKFISTFPEPSRVPGSQRGTTEEGGSGQSRAAQC